MNKLYEPLHKLNDFENVVKKIENNEKIEVSGLNSSQKAHFINSVKSKVEKPALIITSNDYKAQELYDELQFFDEENTVYFPSKNPLFYLADAHSKDLINKRISVIESIVNGENKTIILSIESLMTKMIDPKIFKNSITTLKVGEDYKIDDVLEKLFLLGYERVSIVESRGHFSLRGGILDIYPAISKKPVRIEFFDTEVDSIRSFEVESQRSIDKLEEVTFFPIKELLYSSIDKNNAMDNLEFELEGVIKTLQKRKLDKEVVTLSENISHMVDSIREGWHIDQIDSLISYFHKNTYSILDYISEDYVVYVDEHEKIKDKHNVSKHEFEDAMKIRLEKGLVLPGQMDVVFDYDYIDDRLKKFKKLFLNYIQKTEDNFDFKVKSIAGFNRRMDLLEETLQEYVDKKYKVLFLAGNETKGLRLEKDLYDKNINCVYKEHIEMPLTEGKVVITHGSLKEGFEYTDCKFAVISDRDFFGEEKLSKSKTRKKKYGKIIENFTDLNVGDFIVHANHGIGVYRGIEKITVDNITKDYIKLDYAGNGSLFLSTTQMDNIQKYIGSEGRAPRLSKLDGNDWKKTKIKASEAIQELARELVKLYSKRETIKGYKFSEDTVWQKEFEDMFIYDETEDQIVAIEEVKRDMESDGVMERLICGDVGYGKTEVAIRAAFKAIQDDKQVAYLVPTTILAQQHYNTFIERMKSFPVNVDVLSRFRTPKEQKEAVANLKNGRTDILIGTHRILSKDIEFKNLGLLIVDEEQRFGVAQKEKVKQIRANVDVMSLTATPIPRTLHMSMTGIRDISILRQPPRERLPIQTYVIEYDEYIVREAIYRELAREGQVYYLHNKVKDIEEFTDNVKKMVPEANIVCAHGKMSKKELEAIMFDFINKEIDVLICTTIIETGIDISNVNTIIIDDADKMGLSQLYQIRGRVGRSNKLAYAYLTYKKNKILKDEAEKRLTAIKEFTEFGAGFKIAMRDLEIRGAGNLIGKEQHGHMEAIGYDLYCKLLEDAIHLIKGDEIKEHFETTIEIGINAYIPEHYIEDEYQKLEMYKKISYIRTEEDYMDIWEEIEDRYGDIPRQLQNLLKVSHIKAIANELGICDISHSQNKIEFAFINESTVKFEQIDKLLKKYKPKLNLEVNKAVKITYNDFDINKKNVLEKIEKILEEFNAHK